VKYLKRNKMTPKEKARELVDKFINATDYNGYGTECALIAVDELIYETQFEVPNIRQRYWQQVKQEINGI
jgi:hypothetical protein